MIELVLVFEAEKALTEVVNKALLGWIEKNPKVGISNIYKPSKNIHHVFESLSGAALERYILLGASAVYNKSYEHIIVSVEDTDYTKKQLDLVARFPEYNNRVLFLETWLAGSAYKC